jgi:hypothetical protein
VAIHSRWYQISTDKTCGHYIALRERLDTYVDRLTQSIDSQTHPAIGKSPN